MPWRKIKCLIFLFIFIFLASNFSYGQGSKQNSKVPPKNKLKTEDPDFNIPLGFKVNLNDVVKNTEFSYDLSQENGSVLNMSGVEFSDRTFQIRLGVWKQKDWELPGGADPKKPGLYLIWPESLFHQGRLELISRSGATLWSFDITEQDRISWQENRQRWLDKNKKKNSPNSGIGMVTFFIGDLGTKGFPIKKIKDSFRFCLSESVQKSYTKLCTGRYGLKQVKKATSLVKIKTEGDPRVIFQNEDASLNGNLSLESNQRVQFFAELSTGLSYEFLAPPAIINLTDIQDLESDGAILMKGFGTLPFGRCKIEVTQEVGGITKALGFEETTTIKDDRIFWKCAIPRDLAGILVPGQAGGVFKLNLDLEKIPPKELRLWLRSTTSKSTYSEETDIYGKKPRSAKVSSKEISAGNDNKEGTEFRWTFLAKEKGAFNTSTMNVDVDGRTYFTQYEMFRSYANELSARFTGLISGGSLVIIGEVAYNRWFESLMGWHNYWLGEHRWGMSAKYFKSLQQLTVDASGGKGNFDVMDVNLKYRFTPGMWTVDESHGALLSYQDITFGTIKTGLLGAGWFWARSMPRIFDDLFNYLPYMNYPKWVDMEFIYFTNSMNSNVKIGATYALNFHGQVLWKKNFFGEAGFGLKKIDLTDSSTSKKAAFNIFFGTVGIGFKF